MTAPYDGALFPWVGLPSRTEVDATTARNKAAYITEFERTVRELRSNAMFGSRVYVVDGVSYVIPRFEFI